MELWGRFKCEFCRRKISFWFAKFPAVDWSKARKCSLVIGFGETFLARFCRSLTLSWLWLPKYVQTLMSFTFILPELVLKITIKHKAARIRGNFPHLTASACFKYSRRCLNLKSVLKQASSPESWQLLLFSGVFCSILHSPRVLHFFYKGKGCPGLCQLVYLKLLIAPPHEKWHRNKLGLEETTMTNTNWKLLPLNTYKKDNISYQSRTEAAKMDPTRTILPSSLNLRLAPLVLYDMQIFLPFEGSLAKSLWVWKAIKKLPHIPLWVPEA